MTKRTAKVILFLLSKKLFLVFVKKYFNSKLLDSIMLFFVSLKRCILKVVLLHIGILNECDYPRCRHICFLLQMCLICLYN